MKLNPKKKLLKEKYSTKNEFVTGVGKFCTYLTVIGVSTFSSFVVSANDAKKIKLDKTLLANVANFNKIKLEVAKLAKLLGNKNFKIRENASKQFIFLGKYKTKDNKIPYLNLVLEQLKKSKLSKDIEVSQRAKDIEKILTKVKTPQLHIRPRLLGKIRG